MDMLGTLRKDNTGYDLKHLFIGLWLNFDVLAFGCKSERFLMENKILSSLCFLKVNIFPLVWVQEAKAP